MKFKSGEIFSKKPHKQNFITRIVNQWFDRVVGAMKGEGLSESDAIYDSHRTKRDFVWNSVGTACWSFVFPVVTMVSTQLVGVQQAGMISMAFVIGLLLMFVGNFGTRAYQASDIHEEHSFKDYQVSRWATCVLMLVLGWLYCNFRGYSGEMSSIATAILIYRCVDALADVYEGRLQQVDKLYLAGISQAIRSASALIFFSIFLLVTGSGATACWAMAVVAVITLFVVTLPLTLLETNKSHGFSFESVWRLIKTTAPLFIALFLFNVVENMPKLVMEGVLDYDAQLYFNSLYFPAQCILIVGQLVYKPLIVRMADVWQDDSKRKKFDLFLIVILLVIVGITAAAWFVMATIGIGIMSFFYGIDFEPYRYLSYVMIVTGGVTCAIDFIYQVVTVMRRQKDVTTLYFVTFGFSLFIPSLLIGFEGLDGAILSYLIIESILLVLLVWEYFRIRSDLARESQIRKETAEHVRKSFLNMDEQTSSRREQNCE